MQWQLVLLVLGVNSCWAAYNQQQMREFAVMARACYKELGIPPGSDLWMRVMYGHDMTMNELEKRYIECAQTMLGWRDSDGTYYPQQLIDFFALNADRQLVTKLIHTCLPRMHGETSVEIAASFYHCFFESKEFDL